MEEIMNNDVVAEEAVEVVAANPVNGFKIAAGVGAAALVGFGVYKLGKLIVEKIKARKGKTTDLEAEYEEVETDDFNSEDDE